jgi:predicted outer membrane repeat protein
LQKNVARFGVPHAGTVERIHQTIQDGSSPCLNDVALDGEGSSDFFQCDAGSHAVLEYVTFNNGYGESGGALDNYGSLTIKDCAFNNNYAFASGGAIYNYIDDSYGGGGAIYNAGKATVNYSDLHGNHAAYDGGAIYNPGSLSSSHSSYTANYSINGNGGAIASEGNEYFHGHKSYYSASLSLGSCSFTDNSAYDAEPIYLYDSAFSAKNLSGSI